MKLKTLLIAIVALTTFSQASAQLSFGIGGFVLAPKGTFAKNINTTGGFVFEMGARIPDSRFSIGFDAALNTYASKTELVAYSKPHYQHNEANRERSNNLNIYNFNAKVFAFQYAAIQPYLDARVGFSHFSTNEEFTDPFRNQNNNNSCSSPPSLNTVHILRSNAFNYGGGVGIQANINRLLGGNPTFVAFLFDFRADYLRGGVATYRNIDKVPNPHDARGNLTSNTNMLLFTFGLKMQFVD